MLMMGNCFRNVKKIRKNVLDIIISAIYHTNMEYIVKVMAFNYISFQIFLQFSICLADSI